MELALNRLFQRLFKNNRKYIRTSFSPSSSKSDRVRDETLSPVTVQNGSLPKASNPWIEQLPPTRASGFWCLPNLPTTIAFPPSAIYSDIEISSIN